MLNMRTDLSRRHLYFVLFFLGCLFLCRTAFGNLIRFSLSRDYGSHILLVPLLSAYIVYLKRSVVFSEAQFSLFPGLSGLMTAAVLFWMAQSHIRGDDNRLAVQVVALIVLWISGFILFYGVSAARVSTFPLLFLFLMVPPPDFVIEKTIFSLQAGSAIVATWLFRLLKVPVWREGFILHLPTLNLEVAKECSGIRSSVVLLITTLLVGQFALRSFWGKSLLVVSILPIVIFKNAVRIVTIALLTIYVDRGFLHGWLHHAGGIVFYLLGLLTLVPILFFLRRVELTRAVRSDRVLSGEG
jgi:exosortase